jgi:hypothetical protein
MLSPNVAQTVPCPAHFNLEDRGRIFLQIISIHLKDCNLEGHNLNKLEHENLTYSLYLNSINPLGQAGHGM